MKQDVWDQRNGEGDRIKSVNKTNENTDSYWGEIHHPIKLNLICWVIINRKRDRGEQITTGVLVTFFC